MTKKLKVLIVETEIPTAMLMVSLLTQAGCDVHVAASGPKGVGIAQDQKFDLIVLEMLLPDVNGFKICAELKQRHLSCRTPIIFLSDQLDEKYREQAVELGAADFIAKPFDARDFVRRLFSHVNPVTVTA